MKIYCSRNNNISFERFANTGLWIKCDTRFDAVYIKVIGEVNNLQFYCVFARYVKSNKFTSIDIWHMIECVKLIDEGICLGTNQPYYMKQSGNDLKIINPLEVLTDEEMRELLINNIHSNKMYEDYQ